MRSPRRSDNRPRERLNGIHVDQSAAQIFEFRKRADSAAFRGIPHRWRKAYRRGRRGPHLPRGIVLGLEPHPKPLARPCDVRWLARGRLTLALACLSVLLSSCRLQLARKEPAISKCPGLAASCPLAGEARTAWKHALLLGNPLLSRSSKYAANCSWCLHHKRAPTIDPRSAKARNRGPEGARFRRCDLWGF
jgi:hypothetical protein